MEVAPRPAGVERIVGTLDVGAHRQARSRRELIVEPDATFLLGAGSRLIDVEARERARIRAHVRLALVLEVREVVETISHDWTAVRGAELLVGIWQHATLDWIGRVEIVVAEVARDRSGGGVRPRLGDRVHLHSRRAALPRVETVGDHLELRNRVATEARLAEAGGNELRH